MFIIRHSKKVYKYIHKQHHLWQSPVAVTAIYAHPVGEFERAWPWNRFVWLHGLFFETEHIFSNILPPFLGVFICRSHIATAWLWFTMALLSTLNAHSGYHFPFFPSPQAHDFHHLKWVGIYSTLWMFSIVQTLEGDAWYQALLQKDGYLKIFFRFNCNYGMLGLLDRLHGTDTLFRNSPQGQRHLMLLSFIPAHEQFPNEVKKSS